MQKINFIENPPFEINFERFAVAKGGREEDQKSEMVALTILRCSSIVVVCAAKATWKTFSYSLISFKQIVLGFYGSWSDINPPGDIYILAFKVAYWAFGLVWCAITTTIRLVMDELFPVERKYLSEYAMDGINCNHLRSNESTIDISGVDEKVKVDDLIAIYDAVNFDKKDEPGYMAPTSSMEGNATYSISELREALQTFVNYVNQRKAFIGTPPEFDTPRLMAFYQQIESAVRFSIDSSNRRIAEFQEVYGTDVSRYREESMKVYKGLVEDRARIAIDLAIAGKHCGGRYLGEAMSVYESFCGDDLTVKGSLEDSIIELLARKRYKIAKGQIQRYLGTDTHAYTSYMENLGKALGLPGTENIIEHLVQTFDQELYLTRFFEEYTEDLIIETIQEEFKTSQLFREKVFDWIKDQSGNWKEKECKQDLPKLVNQVLKEINYQSDSEDGDMKLAAQFIGYLQKEQGINLPLLEEGWNAFIDALFGLPEVRQWRDEEMLLDSIEKERENTPHHVRIVRMKKIEKLKSLFKTVAPTQNELSRLKICPREQLLMDLMDRSRKSYKIERVRSIVPLEVETIARVIVKPEEERRKWVQEVIAAQKDLKRRSEFLEQIGENHIKQHVISDDEVELTLSPELMEWLTVSHGVFTLEDPTEDYS